MKFSLTITDDTTFEDIKPFLDNCDPILSDQIYRYLWTDHVIEDIKSHMEKMEITLTDEEIKTAAKDHTYHGDYDCNLTYWENIENNINNVLSDR